MGSGFAAAGVSAAGAAGASAVVVAAVAVDSGAGSATGEAGVNGAGAAFESPPNPIISMNLPRKPFFGPSVVGETWTSGAGGIIGASWGSGIAAGAAGVVGFVLSIN